MFEYLRNDPVPPTAAVFAVFDKPSNRFAISNLNDDRVNVP